MQVAELLQCLANSSFALWWRQNPQVTNVCPLILDIFSEIFIWRNSRLLSHRKKPCLSWNIHNYPPPLHHCDHCHHHIKPMHHPLYGSQVKCCSIFNLISDYLVALNTRVTSQSLCISFYLCISSAGEFFLRWVANAFPLFPWSVPCHYSLFFVHNKIF